MQLDCDIEHWPGSQDWAALAERVVQAASTIEPALVNARLRVSILFTSDAQIHALNREWRGKDRPTNVLSFPTIERGELLALPAGGPPVMLGDIALAYETCAREAVEKGLPLTDHAAHLIVHGLLHLAGFDHETSRTQAEHMEALEIKALATMGLADPYGAFHT